MKKLLSSLSMMIMVFTAYSQSCPDDHHPHMIDLGLPSGTLWACCDVGADKPEDYGGFYAWGETEEKTTYNWSNYIHCDGSDDTCHDLDSDIAGTQYDVAHVKWGGSWVMPSSEQQDELRNNCTYKWTTVNGVKGTKFTSKINGSSIFMPAAGNRWNADLQNAEIYGFFWSSTQGPVNSNFSYVMYFYSGSTDKSIFIRSSGNTVRPVISGTNISAQICPDDHHPHMIDLGLPSGTKWACCNVGADKPEGYGGYYAWGETKEKDAYNEVTYQYCTGENPNDYGWYEHTRYQDLGNDIAGTQYDVAHENWGGSWVMPSLDEIKELFNYCTFTLTSMNGVNGQKFTSKNNGASIFLPAADLFYPGEIGQYWSSTQEPSDLKWAYGLYFHLDGTSWSTFAHPVGLTVRPVISETNSIHLPESAGKSSQAIYNLYGIKVADSVADMNTLHPGIYIVDGKKIVVK